MKQFFKDVWKALSAPPFHIQMLEISHQWEDDARRRAGNRDMRAKQYFYAKAIRAALSRPKRDT